MDDGTAVKKTRQAKVPERIVVGSWIEGGKTFTLSEVQPPEGMTQLGDVLKWMKQESGFRVGEFHFVRMVKGSLVMGEQMEMFSEFKRG